MNALRTLPILNRPSRPASPAPQVTTATVNGVGSSATGTGAGVPLSQNRSRSLSRNLADKVASAAIPVGGLTPQHTGSKKTPSPPFSHPPTPRNVASPLPGAAAPVNGEVPAPAAYMDVIGTRLNEVVNKATAGVDFKQKKGIKPHTGWNLGEAVIRELPFPPNDAYLIRAVLRTAVRSMSIFITRLEALLLPALTDASFVQPLHLTGSHSTNPLNPAQQYALTVAHAAWETCEVLEQTLETGKWPKFVGETLRPVMDKFDLIVGKVVHPLLTGLKRDLVASLGRNEGISPPSGKSVGLPSVPVPSMAPPPLPTSAAAANKEHVTKTPSERGHARQQQLTVPTCFQHFAARVDGSRKVLELVAGPCQDDGEGWITGVLVPVVWKGICVSVNKDLGGAANGGGVRPPSPAAVSKALHVVAAKEAGTANGAAATPTVVASPSLGGVTAKLTSSLSILPSRSASRPASPTRGLTGAGVGGPKYDSRTLAIIALEGLIKRMVGNLVPPPSGEPVTEENLTEHLAREALHEATEALESLRIVSTAVSSSVHPTGPGNSSASARMLSALRRVRDEIDDEAEEALDDAIEDMPSVALFALLVAQANLVLHSADIRLLTPHEAFSKYFPSSSSASNNNSTGEYDRTVLGGFSAAEDWAKRVALALKPDLERVQLHLKEAGVTGPGAEWVKCVGLALEARTGVKVHAHPHYT